MGKRHLSPGGHAPSLYNQGIDYLNDLTPRLIKEFEAVRRRQIDNRITLNTQFGTIRQFLAYSHELDAVSSDVVEAMNVPSLSKDDRVNTEKLLAERAEQIIENLERYRYASAEHVMMLLLWRLPLRLGALRSLDLEDLYLQGPTASGSGRSSSRRGSTPTSSTRSSRTSNFQ